MDDIFPKHRVNYKPIDIGGLPTIIGRENSSKQSCVEKISDTEYKIKWQSEDHKYNCDLYWNQATHQHKIIILNESIITYHYWEGGIAEITVGNHQTHCHDDLQKIEVECLNALLLRILNVFYHAGYHFPAFVLYSFERIHINSNHLR